MRNREAPLTTETTHFSPSAESSEKRHMRKINRAHRKDTTLLPSTICHKFAVRYQHNGTGFSKPLISLISPFGPVFALLVKTET
jgi:hypothetical protein